MAAGVIAMMYQQDIKQASAPTVNTRPGLPMVLREYDAAAWPNGDNGKFKPSTIAPKVPADADMWLYGK